MKRFRFEMEDGSAQEIIARDFRAACLQWEQFGLDPRDIVAMKEFG